MRKHPIPDLCHKLSNLFKELSSRKAVSTGNHDLPVLPLREWENLLKRFSFDSEALKVFRNGKELSPLDLKLPEGRKKTFNSKVYLWRRKELLKLSRETGFSVKIFQISNYLPSLELLELHLSRIFCCRISMNAYYTPARSRCFDEHADPYNICIIQCHGSKKWSVRPDRNSKKKSFKMKQGDIIFLREGELHEAESTDEDSLHLTIGFHHLNLAEFIQGLCPGLLGRKIPISQTPEERLHFLNSQLGKSLPLSLSKEDLARSENRRMGHPEMLSRKSKGPMESEKIRFTGVPYELITVGAEDVLFSGGYEIRVSGARKILAYIFSGKTFSQREIIRRFPEAKSSDLSGLVKDLYKKGLLTS